VGKALSALETEMGGEGDIEILPLTRKDQTKKGWPKKLLLSNGGCNSQACC